MLLQFKKIKNQNNIQLNILRIFLDNIYIYKRIMINLIIQKGKDYTKNKSFNKLP